jgi:hypothetical protein
MASSLAVPAPRAATFGAFHLTADGLQVKGEGEFDDWSDALNAASYLEERSPIWKAELFAYAKGRPDWERKVEQVIDAGRYTLRTVDQYCSVIKNVPRENRVEGTTLSHMAAVASLPSGDQRALLERAKREHLSVSELKRVVQKSKKVRRVLKGQASDLAKAQRAVVESAIEASDLCRQIGQQDCKHAEKTIAKARRELDRCETALQAFRQAQGRKP